MKKFYTLFMLFALAFGLTASAEEVTFDFAANPWGLTLGSGSGETASAGDIKAAIVQDGVSLTFEQNVASTPARMWSNKGAGQLRFYKGGNMTVTAATGKAIKKIVFSGNNVKFDCTPGTISASEWTGNASAIVFTATDKPQINKMVVTVENAGSDTEDPGAVVAVPVITPKGGTKTNDVKVTIAVNEGLTAYYTIDGTDPTDASTRYEEPFTLTESATVKAVAYNAEGNHSNIVSETYTIEKDGTGGEDPTPGTGEKGSVSNPFTVADALALIDDGKGTFNKDAIFYVKGIISEIESVDETGQYGNASYFISDDGNTDKQLYIFRGYYLGGEMFTSASQIKVGDEVILCGKLTYFAKTSTPEMAQGNYIYSLNGTTAGEGGGGGDEPTTDFVGNGSLDKPYTVADALALIDDGKGKYDRNAEVYVKGIISEIEEVDETGQYGNASFFISDDGKTDKQFYIFRGYYLGGEMFTSASQIKVGDEVILCGKLTYFARTSTPEMAQGNYIYSLNGTVATGDDEGTEDNPYTVSKAIEALNSGKMKATAVYVKGKISQVEEVSTEFGNATYYISDDGTNSNEMKVYRGYFLEGKKFTAVDQIKEDDEVIVYGRVISYGADATSVGEPQITTGSSIYSLNGITTGLTSVVRKQYAGTIYDLQGRRVAKAQRGLYIVGGKKVFMK